MNGVDEAFEMIGGILLAITLLLILLTWLESSLSTGPDPQRHRRGRTDRRQDEDDQYR
ncbi:hypothetical protein [Microlunatus ginsengisoli]|jgi:hypothetical protein|uniref:Uncharacterized protein n=1 Tax=Microlunatus ginsengisoli TaxID=363863 RepID=A0ABP7ARH9_9ACTN